MDGLHAHRNVLTLNVEAVLVDDDVREDGVGVVLRVEDLAEDDVGQLAGHRLALGRVQVHVEVHRHPVLAVAAKKVMVNFTWIFATRVSQIVLILESIIQKSFGATPADCEPNLAQARKVFEVQGSLIKTSADRFLVALPQV